MVARAMRGAMAYSRSRRPAHEPRTQETKNGVRPSGRWGWSVRPCGEPEALGLVLKTVHATEGP